MASSRFVRLLGAALVAVPLVGAFTTTKFGAERTFRAPTALSVKRSPILMPNSEPMVPYSTGLGQEQFMPISQCFYHKRIIVLGDFLDEQRSNNLIATLLYLKQRDRKKPISLYINIPGALMKPTMAVYDVLKTDFTQCTVQTINLGLATGMAAFLCAAGTKGFRYALPNSRFLMQKTGLDDPYQGQALDIGLKVRDNVVDNYNMMRELSELTGRPYDQVQEDLKRDFYLSSFEAREYGIVDKVLTPKPKIVRTMQVGASGKDERAPPPALGQFCSDQPRFQSMPTFGGFGTGTPNVPTDDNEPPAQQA